MVDKRFGGLITMVHYLSIIVVMVQSCNDSGFRVGFKECLELLLWSAGELRLLLLITMIHCLSIIVIMVQSCNDSCFGVGFEDCLKLLLHSAR